MTHKYLKTLKYTAYLLLYMIITYMVAYIIFAQTVPNDGQCHCNERPLGIHYILAFVITLFPAIVILYKKKKINK